MMVHTRILKHLKKDSETWKKLAKLAIMEHYSDLEIIKKLR